MFLVHSQQLANCSFRSGSGGKWKIAVHAVCRYRWWATPFRSRWWLHHCFARCVPPVMIDLRFFYDNFEFPLTPTNGGTPKLTGSAHRQLVLGLCASRRQFFLQPQGMTLQVLALKVAASTSLVSVVRPPIILFSLVAFRSRQCNAPVVR